MGVKQMRVHYCFGGSETALVILFWQHKTRHQDKNMKRPDKTITRQDKTRQHKTRQNKTTQDKTTKHKTRHEKT
jgi:hypothetical protein